MFPGNDPDTVRRQYASDVYLRTRQETHEQYTVPKLDFPLWVLRRYHWRGDERVLDLGSGGGIYYNCLREHWPDVTYYGVDQSPGMLAQHPAHGELAVGDAQDIPFPDGTFDVVMANHMLYHVADLDQALIEARRVLKPNGVLIAATNSIQSMPQIHALFRRGMLLLSTPGKVYSQPPLPAQANFALENGTRMLSRYFYAVVRHDLPSQLVFPSIEPVMAYLESTRSMREPQLPESIDWDDLMLVMREQVIRVIDHFGEMVVEKVSGVLLASTSGGFIREYVDKLDHSS
jgi:ubiquinone/menaquinone biosynthesis C-methylase UbiE